MNIHSNFIFKLLQPMKTYENLCDSVAFLSQAITNLKYDGYSIDSMSTLYKLEFVALIQSMQSDLLKVETLVQKIWKEIHDEQQAQIQQEESEGEPRSKQKLSPCCRRKINDAWFCDECWWETLQSIPQDER